MADKKNIVIINGSASKNSSNEKLIANLATRLKENFMLNIFNDLKLLPHFDAEQSSQHPPKAVAAFRDMIERSDGVIICTPEYVFSIPSGLKNAIEWCVATTIFSDKPVGLITASASGQKGHEELQLIMKTIMTTFTPGTTLLIQGIKGKINEEGKITDHKTQNDLLKFTDAFEELIKNTGR